MSQGSRPTSLGAGGSWPGQPGNRVGFAAAPGYPGSLTPTAPFTPVANTTYSFLDIDGGPATLGDPAGGGMNCNVDGVTWIGCRFQCNDVGVTNPPKGYTTGGNCMQVGNVFASTPNNVKFKYCSFTPRVAVVASIPGGGVWPCNGAGVQNPVGGAYQIGADQGYQFGVDNYGTNTLLDHCDIWGAADGVTAHGNFFAALGSITLQDCWIHDCAPDGVDTTFHQHYHTDGAGNLDGSGCTGFTIAHCTIALIAGGANSVAFQSGTYHSVSCTNSFISGDAAPIDMGHGAAGCTNMVFTDNVISSVMQVSNGLVQTDNSPTFTSTPGNVWRRNKFSFWPGTIPGVGTSPQWVPSDDGKFLWPDNTLHATDWTG